MKYQKQFSDVFSKFKENPECLQYFLNCFEIPELKDLKDLTCKDFSEHPLVESVQTDPKISGFVISNKVVEVFYISHTRNYLGFWGFRNFFTYRLAEKHKQINDGIMRYVLNVHYRPDPNRTDTFNDIREFQIFNVYKQNDDLKSWLETIFED